MTQSPTRSRPDIWMLVRCRPAEPVRATRVLAEALRAAYGSRFALWHTDDFLLGVQGGRLTLRTLNGEELSAPDLVLVRQVPGSMGHDREVTLLRHLERMGSTLVNSLESHLACRNKFWQLQELAVAGLPVPASLSYATARMDHIDRTPGIDMPCVVKSVNGYGGTRVFLAPDLPALHATVESGPDTLPVLLQEYVSASHGRDLRVVVVEGEAVAAAVRNSRDGALTSNISQGGRAELCRGRYPEAEALAIRAAQTLGLTIAGVDLLFTTTGATMICEVNAVPGWRPEMTSVIPAISACVDRHLRAPRPEG